VKGEIVMEKGTGQTHKGRSQIGVTKIENILGTSKKGMSWRGETKMVMSKIGISITGFSGTGKTVMETKIPKWA
jgi:DNA-binding NtrC family response regulator